MGSHTNASGLCVVLGLAEHFARNGRDRDIGGLAFERVLARDNVLIHEGALFSNPLPTPMADDAPWPRLPQANFRHVDMSFSEGGYDAIRPHLH